MFVSGVKNVLPGISTRDHVVQTSFNLDSKISRHTRDILANERISQNRRRDPKVLCMLVAGE
jgi:hypothetical protein